MAKQHTHRKQPRCVRIMKKGTPEERQCKNRAVHGSTVCRSHGGTGGVAQLGPANVNWKDGRHSKMFKEANLQQRFREALADPDRFTHAPELAALDVLLEDELAAIGLDAGSAERLWKQASDALFQFEIAMRSKRADKAARQVEAFMALKRVLEEGARDAHARVEARKIIQERVAVADKETARQAKAAQSLNAEQAMMLAQMMMMEVADLLRDQPDTLMDFNRRMFRLFGKGEEASDTKELVLAR